MVRLVGRIAADHDYTGSWLLGIELANMKGRKSSFTNTVSDSERLRSTYRAATRQIVEHPTEVTEGLLRLIFRDFGAEGSLERILMQMQTSD